MKDGLRWNDPQINAAWPFQGRDVTTSIKDAESPASARTPVTILFMGAARLSRSATRSTSIGEVSHENSGDGRRSALSGSALVRHLIAETQREVMVVDKLTYAWASQFARARGASSALSVLPSRHLRSPSDRRYFFRLRSGCRHASRGGKPRRPLDRRAGALHQYQHCRNICACLKRRWRIGEKWVRARSGFGFCTSRPTKFMARWVRPGSFREDSRYDPRSPYSRFQAAASDHLVRAWHHTYGLPALVTNCSNNYGPFQHPEKLIPRMIINGLAGEAMPVYGRGANVRDWLFVDDHVRALTLVLERGTLRRNL